MSSSDSRRYPARPVIGIGALMFDGGCVLLAERGREPLKGQWSLPGGALETGETLKEGVRREVLEETGLEVEPLWIAEVFERIMRDAGGRAEYHYVLVDYVCRIAGGEPRAGDDVSAVRWVPVAALGEYEMTEGTRGVIERAYQKTLQHEPDKR